MLSLLTLSACAGDRPEEEPWALAPFAEQVAEAIAEAESTGASDAQLALLRQAQSDGEVSFELMRNAALAAVECFNAAGAEAEYSESNRASGLRLPGYRVSPGELSEAQTEALLEECDGVEFEQVNILYQQQPQSRALLGAFVESKREVLRDCLAQHGLPTDPEESGWELAHRALEAAEASDFEVDCLGVAGIDGL